MEMLMTTTLVVHPRKGSAPKSRSPRSPQDGAIIGAARIDRDEDLVTGLRSREQEAAEILVARYGDRLYRLAIRITGSEQDAEEVVQDALWTATRKIDTFRGDSSLSTWLHRIAVNAANQKRRTRRGRRNEVSRDELFPSFSGHGQPGDPVPDSSARMEDPALQMELRSVLTSAIDDLRDGHCISFLLHDVEGLSNHEISALLRVKVGTVKSRVHRARSFLRGRLTGYMTEESGAAPDDSASSS
jgi:RNA polymerase sigma-70 factor (ECF subfamily)